MKRPFYRPFSIPAGFSGPVFRAEVPLSTFFQKKFRRDVDLAVSRSSYEQDGQWGLLGSQETRQCV